QLIEAVGAELRYLPPYSPDMSEAAWMAHSDDLRKRVVEAVFRGGMSRNAAGERFEVSIASAVRWAHRFSSTGAMSPAPTGGDRRSNRIEAHGDQESVVLGKR